MRERCPNSHPRGKVVLTDYQLCFDEYSSRWGVADGYCNYCQLIGGAPRKVGKQNGMKVCLLLFHWSGSDFLPSL